MGNTSPFIIVTKYIVMFRSKHMFTAHIEISCDKLRFFSSSSGRKNLVSCHSPTTLSIFRKVVQSSSRFSLQNNSSSYFNIRYQFSSKSVTFSKMAIKGVNMSYPSKIYSVRILLFTVLVNSITRLK